MASCWVSVEPPCETPRCRMLATAARAMPERIDPVMRIEPAVFDGDEGLRQIGRQILQRNIGAGHFAARRQHAAVEADDLDGRRPFRNLERLDRRQMRADPDHDADHGDRAPQAKHRAPIDQPSDAEFTARFRAAFGAAARSGRLALARRRRHRRMGAWAIFSVCLRRRQCGPPPTGANPQALREARIAAPCVRRLFSVPTPYAIRRPHRSRRTLARAV